VTNRALIALSLAAALPAVADAPRDTHDEAAARLLGHVLADPTVYGRLQHLTDSIGPRLSGSDGYAQAAEWTAAQLRADGLEVRLEKVMVPHWVRGVERGGILPAAGRIGHPLALTALGGSAGTPAGGVEADVILVRSIDEVAALGELARGKIVFFQHDMHEAAGYGKASRLRTRGPEAASKVAAVAALVRSAASASIRSPHTGATTFDAAPAIPAAAISTEDADLIERLLQQGPVRVRLELGCQTLPDVEAANVVAELKGSEKPDEIVLISGHLDSWDLATGAIDDGAGVAMVMGAMRSLARLPQRPRRTVRAVLFANEENGLRGGKAYQKDHAAELARHAAAIEMDSGAGRVESIEGHGAAALFAPLMGASGPLAALGIKSVGDGGHGGADIGALGRDAQVPFLDLSQDHARYFDWHHSAADTLDKVDPRELAQATAALSLATWVLADSPGTLERRAPESRRK
jgi:hypothetical protein